MKRQIVLCLIFFSAFSLFAGDLEVEFSCRVLTPEEYGGNGYIISRDDLIDGAFVEVTNLSNLKKSTAVVRAGSGSGNQGVISSPLAINLGIPFNGTADVSVRYISFLKDRNDVYAPFYTAEETDTEKMKELIAQQQEKLPEQPSATEPEGVPLAVTDAEGIPLPSQPGADRELPVPEWKMPEEGKPMLVEEKRAPETQAHVSQWNRAPLPDESLFKMDYVVEPVLKDENRSGHEAVLPEVEIEQPGYVNEETGQRTVTDYSREISEIPVWRQETATESYMPRPRNLTVLVNGNEIALAHYPEVETDCYRIIDDRTQVAKMNPLFKLNHLKLPQTVTGTGVEDPIVREEIYARNNVAEPRVVQIKIEETPRREAARADLSGKTSPREKVSEEKRENIHRDTSSNLSGEKAASAGKKKPHRSSPIEKPSLPARTKVVIEEPDRPESPLISGALYLQAGVYASQTAAEKQAEVLRSVFPTVVFKAEHNGQTVYKIAVGPVSSDEIGVVRLYLKSFRIRDSFPIIGR